MHYTVQIASYFPTHNKLRRMEFPHFPNLQLPSFLESTDPESIDDSKEGDYEPIPKQKRGESLSGDMEAYGSEESKPAENAGVDQHRVAEHAPGYAYDDETVADKDDDDDDGVDDVYDDDDGADDDTYDDDDAAKDDDEAAVEGFAYVNDDDDAAIVSSPVHAQPPKSGNGGHEYGYFDDDEKNGKGSTTAKGETRGEKPVATVAGATTNKPVKRQSNGKKIDASAPTTTTAAAEIATATTGTTTNSNSSNKKKKGKKPRDPYNYVVNIDPDWGVEGKWDLEHIKVMPTKKQLIKKDRRVIFPHFVRHELATTAAAREPPSGIVGSPRELGKANAVLERHPLYHNNAFDKHEHSLEDVMYFVKNSPTCQQQPIYLTMATVKDDLYWQLIENFVYTLVKFEVSDCSLVICVSDLRCMQMCDAAKFPCFNYVSDETPLPSVMEQIAQVKLLHVPKALTRGVSNFSLSINDSVPVCRDRRFSHTNAN